MKKAVFILFLFTMPFIVFAQSTEYRDACRKILYAVNPVEAIGILDEAALTRLGRYSMGIPAATAGQEKLNATDTELFSFLATTEMERRNSTPDEFSLYIQEEHERLAPLMRRQGDTSVYIKEDGWLDLYQLNLMFAD
ncbi:MAG: hypothetical protein LBH43_07165 [Treponema sp.]|jgi:hypothetical protein|nr:hypothetical protein [Treponema sp.]